ncbi:MAG: 2OG-Fe(II) oxygenase [Myxococcaceae bacterium]|nr:2OG-Fe(II) oxygenase [Myxococcaceae bacterium]
MPFLDDQALQELGERAVVVRPAAFPDALAAAARAEAQGLGGRVRAGTGKGRAVSDEVRRDETLWVEPHGEGALATFARHVEALRLELNRGAYLGLTGFELQLARYAPGGFYAAHRDTFRADEARRITAIAYLNPGWEPAHGGALRLHLDGGAVDVAPRAGTLVVFRSHLVLHEVLPATVERYALTAWLRAGG